VVTNFWLETGHPGRLFMTFSISPRKGWGSYLKTGHLIHNHCMMYPFIIIVWCITQHYTTSTVNAVS